MPVIIIDPYHMFCPFCLGELKNGAKDDGSCVHEPLLNGNYIHDSLFHS